MESKVLYIIGIALLLIGGGMMISEHSSGKNADVQKTQDTIIEMEDPVIEYEQVVFDGPVDIEEIPSKEETVEYTENVPIPKTYLGTELYEGNKTITKAKLMAQVGIFAKSDGGPANLRFHVESFTVRATIDDREEILKSTSAAFTAVQKTLMCKLKIGDTVYFEDIKAKGNDGSIRDLEPFSLTIIR